MTGLTIQILQAEGYDALDCNDSFIPITHDGPGLFNSDPTGKPLFSHNAPTISEKVWDQCQRYDLTVLNVADFIVYVSQIEDITGLSFFSDSIDINQCRALWDSLRSWLKEQGYTLYTYLPVYRYESPHTDFSGEQMHPFAYFVKENQDSVNGQWEYPFSFSIQPKVRILASS